MKRLSCLASLLLGCSLVGMGAAVQAAPAWTAEDDIGFVQSFVSSYTATSGSAPSEQLVQASLSCHRHYYNQAAAAGSDVNTAASYSLTSCRNIMTQLSGSSPGSRSSGSGTLFNSSGDASLSTDSKGCMYYSSGGYSFSNC